MLDYFKPKRFEMLNGKSIHGRFGVDFFKKHLLVTDLILFRARGKKQFDLKAGGRRKELERLEWQTRRDESIHLICMGVIAAMAWTRGHDLTPAQWIGVFLINLYANVYPILLQRHNRIRILKLLARRGVADRRGG